MPHNREMRPFYLYIVCSSIAYSSLIVAPSNVAVITGSRMSMECTADNGSKIFKWTIKRPNSSNEQQIVRRLSNKTVENPEFKHFRYNLDNSGACDIFTNSTQLSDAGIYICHVEESEQIQLSAHLIVFENEPTCETNYTGSDNTTLNEGDHIQMRCSVKFRGFWSPDVEWRRHTSSDSYENGERLILDGISTETTFNSHITSTLIVVPDYVQNTYFSCRIFFKKQEDTIPVTANNVPNYTYTWNSPEMSLPVTSRAEDNVQSTVGAVWSAWDSDDGGRTRWYIIALVLVAAVLGCIFLVIVIVIRRVVLQYRRIRGLGNSAPTPSTPPHLCRPERPSSGSYEVIPFTTPNIYDGIEENGQIDDTTMQFPPPNQHDRTLTQCYSNLSHSSRSPVNSYEALNPYLIPLDIQRPEDLEDRRLPAPRDEAAIIQHKEDNGKIGIGQGNMFCDHDYLNVGSTKDGGDIVSKGNNIPNIFRTLANDYSGPEIRKE